MTPKPIQLPKETINAMLNGATSFIVPIVNPCKFYSDRGNQAIRIEPKNTDWYKDRNYCIRDNDGGWLDLTKKDFINHVNAPLQPQDEFFIQEDFYQPLGSLEIIYKNDYLKNHIATWQGVSVMTYEQSRLKGKVLTCEIKYVQELSSTEWSLCNDNWLDTTVGDWYDSQHGENAYEKNGYVFLYTV